MKHPILHLCAAGLIAWIGVSPNATAAEAPVVAEDAAPPPYRPWTVGIEGGSQGLIGGFGLWRFSDHLGTRLGVDYTEFSDSTLGIKGIHYDANVRLLAEPLTLDVYPWKKSSFRVSIGLSFNQNELTGTASDTGTIIIAGQPFPTEQVGSLNLRIKQQPVNPYLGIAGNFFYFDHAHHWAMGGELGVAYTGGQDVSLTRSGPPSPLIDNAVSRARDEIERYADQLKWWPVAKLFVSFSF